MIIMSQKADRNYNKRAAFTNVITSIDLTSCLPHQIFVGIWSKFLFFESDRIFSPSFAGAMQDLILAEQSTCCCLLNASRTEVMDFEKACSIFLDSTINENEYYEQLRTGGPAEGWLFSMDRYGCASDKGGWSIYCEKNNDVAVIGLQNPGDVEQLALPLKKLHAEPITKLVEQASTAVFPFSELTEEWRSELSRHYAHR